MDIYFSEPFESKLETVCPFTPKYFSALFLKTRKFSLKIILHWSKSGKWTSIPLIHSSCSAVAICPGSSPWSHIALSCMFLWSPSVWIRCQVREFRCVDVLKCTGQCFGRVSPGLGVRDVLSWLDSGPAFLGGCHGSDIVFSCVTSGGPRVQFAPM